MATGLVAQDGMPDRLHSRVWASILIGSCSSYASSWVAAGSLNFG